MYILRFKQSVSPDVVANRVRIRPANTPAQKDSPYEDVAKPPVDTDGFSRIALDHLTQAQGLDGRYDVHLTAIDEAGHESPFLEVDNQVFDFVPPEAPTEGTVEGGRSE